MSVKILKNPILYRLPPGDSVSDIHGLFYDRATGHIGFGRRYGEQSFNGAPVHSGAPEEFWGSRGPLYNPFLRPAKIS
ncbi:MAG TPA: hypothetical protein VF789_24950 [Thermoanaerobaculia bacterium]